MYYSLITPAVLFTVSGRDCTRYLNARLSNDINSVGEAQSILAALLTAQGQLQALASVCADKDGYLLAFDGGDAKELESLVLQFKVADDVQLTHQSEYCILHTVASPNVIQAAIGHAPETLLDGSTSSDAHSHVVVRTRSTSPDGAAGFDIYGNKESLQQYATALTAKGAQLLTEESFQAIRLAEGTPSVPLDLEAGFFFPELELDSAVSETKGCYVGQEAVEMARSRGKLPAKLFRIDFGSSAELPEAGTKVIADEDQKVLGVLTSAPAGKTPGETPLLKGLARIRKYQDLGASTKVTCGDVAATLEPR